MASLLVFHLLGLYPVPSSRQLLISVPFVSSYSISNAFFGTTTTVTVQDFDKGTLVQTPPVGSNIYVQSVTIRGVARSNICWIDWKDIVGGGEIVIVVGPVVKADGCGSAADARPASLETGGFS